MSEATKVRAVQLIGGPWDGMVVYVTHGTAICMGELYLYDGKGDIKRLIYAPDLFGSMDPAIRETERTSVAMWREGGYKGPPPPMPVWRLLAWIEAFRYDVKV